MCCIITDGLGGYFGPIKNTPEKFLHPVSDKVKAWLRKLKAEGKKIVALTSSFYEYAENALQLGLGWV